MTEIIDMPADDDLSRPGPLDIGAREGSRLLAQAAALVVRHAVEVTGGPVAPTGMSAVEMRQWLAGFDFAHPCPAEDTLRAVVRGLSESGVHTTHPRYFGLFNPTPTWWGVAGEVLAAGLNPQLAAYSHAPLAVEVERHVLRFLGARLGLPSPVAGGFTTGGTEANLSAVILALTRRFPEYSKSGVRCLPRRPVLYASAESHHSWLKIAHLTGLGRDAVRLVGVDSAHRMDPELLRRMRDTDLAAGAEPFLLVGTAGTTAGGAVDPLPELAALAARWGVHLHVDAAWAGAAALSDRLRPLLAGVEHADSVTIDAHKWLSAPMGAGIFLTPHATSLPAAFQVSTGYMPSDTEDAGGVADPYATSVQWSRRFAGLKVFLALAAVGRAGYAEQIERDTRLGALLAARLADHGWERVNDTPLPVVCVADPEADRLGPDGSQAWHNAVADHVVAGGHAWVSTVRLAGRPAIRLCLTSHRTTAHDIDRAVAALDDARAAVGRPAPQASDVPPHRPGHAVPTAG
ncbi:MAG TPA: pyridoxal-dependent decarboxylase [Amycolatopsis sp.]|jgi:glutamate/tyrosine decarboxylase-like PLP-dependent enzyme|nr:pyridoxal-dependent decarboxylase [Amycolatopsis sp.]